MTFVRSHNLPPSSHSGPVTVRYRARPDWHTPHVEQEKTFDSVAEARAAILGRNYGRSTVYIDGYDIGDNTSSSDVSSVSTSSSRYLPDIPSMPYEWQIKENNRRDGVPIAPLDGAVEIGGGFTGMGKKGIVGYIGEDAPTNKAKYYFIDQVQRGESDWNYKNKNYGMEWNDPRQESSFILNLRGHAAKQHGDIPEAREYFERAIEKHGPKKAAMPLYNLAALEVSQGHIEKGIELLTKAVAQAPEFFVTLAGRDFDFKHLRLTPEFREATLGQWKPDPLDLAIPVEFKEERSEAFLYKMWRTALNQEKPQYAFRGGYPFYALPNDSFHDLSMRYHSAITKNAKFNVIEDDQEPYWFNKAMSGSRVPKTDENRQKFAERIAAGELRIVNDSHEDKAFFEEVDKLTPMLKEIKDGQGGLNAEGFAEDLIALTKTFNSRSGESINVAIKALRDASPYAEANNFANQPTVLVFQELAELNNPTIGDLVDILQRQNQPTLETLLSELQE